MTKYLEQLCAAMRMFGEHPQAIILGQAVACKGTGMSATFDGVPREKLLEMPVVENLQLGMSIGMSLAGHLPLSVFPRFNFLLCAMDQLVLHLDKMPLYSRYKPKVIIRTAVATPEPLDPGPQHLGDFTTAFYIMLRTVSVVRLDAADQIVPEYRKAMDSDGPTLLVERTELYG